MNTCESCGRDVREDAAFCDRCGMPLRSPSVVLPVLASRGRRLVAKFIDVLVAGAFTAIFWLSTAETEALAVTILTIGLGVGFFYLTIADGLGSGQSYGKRLLRIRVVHMLSGVPCSYGRSILRNVVPWFLGPLCVVDWALALGKRRQRFGDKAAHTLVTPARAGEGAALRVDQVLPDAAAPPDPVPAELRPEQTPILMWRPSFAAAGLLAITSLLVAVAALLPWAENDWMRFTGYEAAGMRSFTFPVAALLLLGLFARRSRGGVYVLLLFLGGCILADAITTLYILTSSFAGSGLYLSTVASVTWIAAAIAGVWLARAAE